MNNYQLNNTSVYLGGQCKWDLVLENDGNELSVKEFYLSPLSSVIPFYVDPDINPLNYDHGYNLKSFYESTKGTFWDSTYSIDEQSGYDISRYAGCRRRDYNTYKKQFEYLQPIWLESLSEDSKLKFEFICYLINNGIRGRILSIKTLELSEEGFGKYFYDWLRKLRIKGPWVNEESNGNNKTAYVSFDDNQFAISGVNVSSGEPTGVINLNYIINNFIEYERPLIETDNMIIKTFRDYNTIASQLYNFNFCFNLADIMDSQIYNIIKSNPVSIDCVVSIDGESIKRTSILTNYEKIDKSETLNFIPVGGTNYDGDSIEEILTWVPNEETQKKLDDGSISRNVLDYLRDYEYPKFTDLNKLTQDIIHWGYTKDPSRTFNLYNGYRGLLKYPDGTSTITETGIEYKYGLCYDDKSNNVACSTNLDTYGNMNNGLNWIQPGRVLIIESSNDVNNVTYYSDDYVGRYGVSINDIASYWSVDNPESFIPEDISERPNPEQKLLFVYLKNINIESLDSLGSMTIIYSDLHFIQTSSNYDIITTTNLDRFMLANWGWIENDSLFYNTMSLIENIVYSGNCGIDIYFRTEICSDKNELGELEFYKSKNHEHHPHRHGGGLIPFVCPATYNYIYTIDTKTNSIIEKDNYKDSEEDPDPFEYVWYESGRVRELYPELSCEFDAECDESWYDGVKLYLKNLYNLDEKDKDYVFELYNCDMNFSHILDGNEQKVHYKIKMNLL